MRFVALATDYDGTLARDGIVPSEAVAALERLAATGRKLILVTGRELDQLLEIFPQIDRFDSVVAENGALLYTPGNGRRQALADPPPPEFIAALRSRGVPVSVGSAIVATVEPYETVVLEAIRDFGLELQVIFNKGAVMVLPPGVNKASGLTHALHELKVPADRVVGVGDAENDHAFLDACGFGVAVANAVPALKEHAKLVTAGAAGDGVLEVIQKLIAFDL